MSEQDKPKVNPTHEPKDFLSNIMRGDAWIWTIYIFLFCLSAVEIFSASSQLTYRSTYVSDPAFSHIKHLFSGAALLLLTQSRSFKSISAWGKCFYLVGVFLAFITPFFGVEQKGAARSIAGIQPIELLKIGLVLVLCSAVTARDSTYHFFSWFRSHTRLRRYYWYLALIALAALPIIPQNLSSGLILCMSSLGILFVGKVYGKYIWNTIGIVAVFGFLFLGGLRVVYESHKNVNGLENIEANKESHGLDGLIDRSLTWANRIYDHSDVPLWEEKITDKKSQELCAHMALVNGFHFPMGQFFGNSKMRDFLPEAFSDYIFAIIFEETGPFGGLLVILAYLVLFGRCYYLSRHTSDPGIRLLMIGIPLIIVIQALMHIGVNTGAMFVTGQPLPLLSRGGSSIWSTSIMFGLLMALSRIIRQERQEQEQRAQATPVIDIRDASSISEPKTITE